MYNKLKQLAVVYPTSPAPPLHLCAAAAAGGISGQLRHGACVLLQLQLLGLPSVSEVQRAAGEVVVWLSHSNVDSYDQIRVRSPGCGWQAAKTSCVSHDLVF